MRKLILDFKFETALKTMYAKPYSDEFTFMFPKESLGKARTVPTHINNKILCKN